MRTVAETPRPFPRGTWKLVAFGLAVIFALAALVARLTQIQLVEGARFAAAARANQIRRIPVAAPRGRMYDRNGVVLVRSRPSFVCAMIPSDVRDIAATMTQLARVLAIPEDVLWKRLLHHRGINYANFDEVATYEPYGPIVLASDLSSTQMARLAEAQDRLPGLDLEAQPVRDYPYRKLGSHFFGYVGAITEDEYRALKGRGYTPNDVIGKEGLGRAIRCVSARRARRRTDRSQRRGPTRCAGSGPVDPVPGNSLILSIDWRIQELAETALREQLAATSKLRGHPLAGAVVVLDPRDGGVLALASYPNFDPNDFTNGIKESTYARYLNDPLRPLYDRAIARRDADRLDVQDGHRQRRDLVRRDRAASSALRFGRVELSRPHVRRHRVGRARHDDVRARARRVVRRIFLSTRLSARSRAATPLGAGVRPRQPARHRRAGRISGQLADERVVDESVRPAARTERRLSTRDRPGRDAGDAACRWPTSPRRSSTAARSSGRTSSKRSATSHGRIVKRFEHEIVRRVPVTQEALREVRAGMDQVTQPWGTAYGEDVPGVPYGGKTGTAETDGGAGPNTTWFVAYAPSSAPKLAIAVFMERSGGYGANTAAPVARRIIAGYFHKKLPQ